MRPQDSNAVRTEQEGAVLTVWLHNPPFNFLTTPMMVDLLAVVRRANADDSIRAVVLTSAVPDVFISHFDVTEILAAGEAIPMPIGPKLASAALRSEGAVSRIPGARAGLEHTPAAGVVALKRYHEVVTSMRGSDVVYVAAINGRALGGGCELALACDIRVMADGPYEIGQPEIVVGLTPGGGGTQALARAVGISRAIELCLEGRLMTPGEARDIGLVHELVPSETLLEHARTTAARLARRQTKAVGSIKRAIYKGGSASFEHGLHLDRVGFIEAVSDPGTRAALRHYLDVIDEAVTDGSGVEGFLAERLPDWLNGTAHDFHGDGTKTDG